MRPSNEERMSVEWVTRVTGDPRYEGIVRDMLVRHLSQNELDDRIADLFELEGKSVGTARMNLIGNLRWRGYEIPKTPRGDKSYRISGWSKPRDQNYPEDERDLEVAERVSKLRPFDPQTDLSKLSRLLSTRDLLHVSFENCLGYVLCYGLSRYDLFWGPYNDELIFRRFPHHPRYLVMALTDNFESHLLTGRSLLGTRDVTIFNLDSRCRILREGKDHTWKSRRQVIYSTEEICQHPENYLSKTQMNLLKKHWRTTHWTQLNGEECRDVIDRWAEVNKRKHPQIALGRDYDAVSKWWPGKVPSKGGFRKDSRFSDSNTPVCFSVVDHLPNHPFFGVHLVEKALNYRVDSMPGGEPGTSDFNIVMTCASLFEIGVTRLNGGQYQGVGEGLARHKKRYQHSIHRAYEVVLSPEIEDEGDSG